MAATSSRTPTHLAKGKIRNGSILYGSTRVISGAPTQIQTLTYRWTHGSHIWSRPSKLPDWHETDVLCVPTNVRSGGKAVMQRTSPQRLILTRSRYRGKVHLFASRVCHWRDVDGLSVHFREETRSPALILYLRANLSR